MITFHKLGELGRLGNQLFQYAALKGLALKNGYEVKIPNPQTMSWHGQTSLLDKFNIECEYATQYDIQYYVCDTCYILKLLWRAAYSLLCHIAIHIRLNVGMYHRFITHALLQRAQQM
jgi:hypothetical protein